MCGRINSSSPSSGNASANVLTSCLRLAPLGPGQRVEEEGETEVVAFGERGDELARVHLESTHLAGRKEEQVHPDQHGGPH